MKRYYTIDYEAAKNSGVSLMEWVILENISFFQAKYGVCDVSKKELAEFHGITDRMYRKYIQKLSENGFILITNKGVKCSKKWFRVLSFNEGERNKSSEIGRNKSSAKPEQKFRKTGTKVPPLPIKRKKERERESVAPLDATPTDALEVAEYLLQKIRTQKQNFKTPNINEWAKQIDRAIRIDGRTKEELIACIDWIYKTKRGNFWIPNILSGKKLREKFDQMELQMMQSDTTTINRRAAESAATMAVDEFGFPL